MVDAPSTVTKAELIPALCPILRKLPRSSCVWRERRLDSGTLLVEHTPRINGCQHRTPFLLPLTLRQPTLSSSDEKNLGCGDFEGCAKSQAGGTSNGPRRR